MKTYNFKLYTSNKNRYLYQRINLACEIYNHCIALHRRYYRLYGKYLHVHGIQKHITKLKKQQNQRNDFHFKLANDLTDRYDVMSFETLNLKGMQRMWVRKISDLGFASFISILKYVASVRDIFGSMAALDGKKLASVKHSKLVLVENAATLLRMEV